MNINQQQCKDCFRIFTDEPELIKCPCCGSKRIFLNPEKGTKEPRGITSVLVIVKGGVVQDIRADRQMKVMVHDWDNPSREIYSLQPSWNKRKEQRR